MRKFVHSLLMFLAASVPTQALAGKLHTFIEHETFYALNGGQVLDVDLKSGVISIVDGESTVLEAQLTGLGKQGSSRHETGRVLWVGSVDVVDGRAIQLAAKDAEQDALELQQLGGSWLLAYEYRKWTKGVGSHNKAAASCGTEIKALVDAVLAVLDACGEGGGGAACMQALDDLDNALPDYLRCVEAQPIE